MKKKKLAIGAAVAVVVGIIVVRDVSKATSVRSAVVAEGPIQAYVEERAHTSLPRIYHITMPLQGRVLPITVEEGDAVAKGQVVAHLEDVDWRDTSTQVAELVVAMENTVAAALAQIKASEARTAYTKWVWEANEKAQDSVVSERDKQQSKWEYLDSQVELEGNTATYHAVQAFDTITKMLQPYVQRNFERTVVRSPVEGTILKRHVWNEKVMTPGSPLLDIGNLDELEITAEILTEEAVRIQPGDHVQIYGEGFGDKYMNGTVRRIEPEAFTKLSSLGVEQQRVNVNIAFDSEEFSRFKEAGYTVGLHYRARVRIVTDEKELVVLVPRTALFRGSDGGWQTYRIENGRVRMIDLELGLSNNHFAEVVDGLAPGDVVVDAPESAIEDGLRVVVAK